MIFSANIPDTTGRQMTMTFPRTSSNVCCCTTWAEQNKQNVR